MTLTIVLVVLGVIIGYKSGLSRYELRLINDEDYREYITKKAAKKQFKKNKG